MSDKVSVEKDLEDLIPGFLENRHKDVLELRVLIQNRNVVEISKIGHRLKGTCGGYGFAKLSELGKVLEGAGKESDFSAIETALGAIEAHLSHLTIEYVES